jgi:hypothetical protein
MAWEFNADNQKKYDEVTATICKLQAEMGIKPKTIEERAADYQKRKEEQSRLTSLVGNLRPAPKWKI